MLKRPLSLALVLCPLLLGACKKQTDTQSPADASADASGDAGDASGSAGGGSDSEPAAAEFLTVDEFESEMETKKNDIATCYAQAKETKADLAGKLAIDVTVAGDGSVEKLAFDPGNTIKDPALNACVDEKARSWKFPKTRDGASMTLPYSLNLQ